MTKLKTRIMEHFFDHPTQRMRVREIERVIKVPLPSAIRYAQELTKERILKLQTISNIRLYSSDRDSEHFRREKTFHNIRRIFGSGLAEHLKEFYSSPPMILFGSFSRGEDTEESDIDIYIQTPLKKLPDLRKYELGLNKRIQLITSQSLAKIDNKELANNIINGIRLNGQIEVIV